MNGGLDEAWTEWPAPAKLNLFLHVTGRREDGYHNLQTVFQLLDWGDRIRLACRADGVVSRKRGLASLSPQADLTVRAAHLLAKHTGTNAGVDIEVDKRIPAGAGLGGGSSDAATVLVALNELWRTGLSVDTLAALGATLGADVPLFVRGHSAWAEGVGEKLTPLALGPRWYVLVDSRCEVSTAQLFQAPELTRDAPKETISRFVCGQVTDNAFESVVRARHAQVAAALDWLAGHAHARMSGSGGAVFAEVADRAHGEALQGLCPSAFSARVVRGVDHSPLAAAVAKIRIGA